MKQKFKSGSFVMIAKDLGPSMRHFTNNKPAMIKHTYSQMFAGGGRSGVKEYALLIRHDDNTWRESAWYEEHQLTNITDVALLAKFKKELKGKVNKIYV